MSTKKILFVGETVLDIIQVVSSFPKEDDDIRSKHGRWQRGGNASNNCTVISLLGEKAEILSSFSTSEMFKFVIHDLTVRNIDHKNCVYYDNCEVPLSSIWLSEETGSRTVVHSNPNLPHISFEGFDKVDLSEYKWIHFEVGWGRTPSEFRKMMEKTRKFSDQIKISVELEKPRGEDMLLIDFADYVFLGKSYANFMGINDKKEALYELRKNANRSNFSIICPWGEEGATALDTENNFYTSPAFPPPKVIDTLGAGDTFSAATIYALNQNKNLGDAITFGCQVAGAKVGFYGYDEIKNIFGSKKNLVTE